VDKTTIIKRIQSEDNILSIPAVISEIIRLTNQEDFSSDALSKLILKDPSLTGKILKLANSPTYSRPSEIKTIQQAITIMGMTTVKCLALSSSVFQPDKVAQDSGVDSRDLFSYIITAASAAEVIAKTVGYKSPEEVLIAGILQDIGMLFFVHYYPAEYNQVMALTREGKNLLEAEEAIFNVNHAVVGYHLTRKWSLPENIVNSVANHHNIHELNENETLSSIVKLGVLFTFNNFSGQEDNIEERMKQIQRISQVLGVDQSQLDKIRGETLSQMISMAESIGVEIESNEELLLKANQEIWKSYLTIESLFREREELNQKILLQERNKAALDARNTTLATLSHYLNNTVMIISGQAQLMKLYQDQGQQEKINAMVPKAAEIINKSVFKIVAVMEEVMDISPSEEVEFFSNSKAMNIDERIRSRIKKIADEPAAIFPPKK